MRVIAGISASAAGRIFSLLIRDRHARPCRASTMNFARRASWIVVSIAATTAYNNAPAHGRGVGRFVLCCCLAAIADEAQKEQEQVDEVQIKRQCAHYRGVSFYKD